MKRSTKRLLAGALAVALLGGAYALLLTHPKEDTQDKTVALTQIEPDSVTGIAVSLRNGEHFAIDCVSDDAGTRYVMTGDEDGNYDDNRFSALRNTVCDLSGTLVDSSGEALDRYALSDREETDTITVTQADGTETTLLFGLASDTLEGTYCRCADRTDVVFVSHETAETLLRGQKEYLSVNVLHSYYSLSTDLQRLTVDSLSDGTTLTIRRRDTTGLTDAQAGAYSTYVITKPQRCDANDAALSSALLTNLQTGLTARGIAAVHADKAQLADYGLDTPTATLTLAFDNATEVVFLGSTDGDSLYVRCRGDNTVYDCPASAFDFLRTDWTEYRSTKLLAFAKSQLRRATLTVDGTTTTVKLTYVEADENEENNVDTMTGTRNGTEMETADIDKLYTALTALHAVSIREEPADGQPLLTATVRLSDGTRHTLALTKGGSREYLAAVDGSGYRYTVAQSGVDALLDAFGAG